MTSPQCPTCNGSARHIGRVPDSVDFAGAERDEVFAGGHLYACRACGLVFKCPRLPDAKLDALYRSAPTEAWAAGADDRVDWQLARDILARQPTDGAILDIGCWDGRFLQSLPVDRATLHGIEMNPGAAEQARQRGVTIVSDDLRSLDEDTRTFGVITAFDVIEHVPDPLAFLRACAAALAPGGRIILATGNAASGAFRLLGGRHLYCVWPEHLAFVSPGWFAWAAPRVGLRLHDCLPYRRTTASAARIAIDWLKNVAYRAAPCLFSTLRRAGVGNRVHPVKTGYPPQWITAKDHILAVLEKPTGGS